MSLGVTWRKKEHRSCDAGQACGRIVVWHGCPAPPPSGLPSPPLLWISPPPPPATNPHSSPYDRTITTYPTHFHLSLYATPHPPRVAPMPCEGVNTQYTHHGHKWGVGGHMRRSPQGGLSAGTDRRKVVMCPRRGSDPASGHPRAQKPPLGRDPPPPVWGVHLDARGQQRGRLSSSV